MDFETYKNKVNHSRAFPVNTGAQITVLSTDYAEVVLPIKPPCPVLRVTSHK